MFHGGRWARYLVVCLIEYLLVLDAGHIAISRVNDHLKHRDTIVIFAIATIALSWPYVVYPRQLFFRFYRFLDIEAIEGGCGRQEHFRSAVGRCNWQILGQR